MSIKPVSRVPHAIARPCRRRTIWRNPIHATTPRRCRRPLQQIKDHLRDDIEKVDEPQLKAMFETAAEVLGGLIKAFRDYEQKNESAWSKAS